MSAVVREGGVGRRHRPSPSGRCDDRACTAVPRRRPSVLDQYVLPRLQGQLLVILVPTQHCPLLGGQCGVGQLTLSVMIITMVGSCNILRTVLDMNNTPSQAAMCRRPACNNLAWPTRLRHNIGASASRLHPRLISQNPARLSSPSATGWNSHHCFATKRYK